MRISRRGILASLGLGAFPARLTAAVFGTGRTTPSRPLGISIVEELNQSVQEALIPIAGDLREAGVSQPGSWLRRERPVSYSHDTLNHGKMITLRSLPLTFREEAIGHEDLKRYYGGSFPLLHAVAAALHGQLVSEMEVAGQRSSDFRHIALVVFARNGAGLSHFDDPTIRLWLGDLQRDLNDRKRFPEFRLIIAGIGAGHSVGEHLSRSAIPPFQVPSHLLDVENGRELRQALLAHMQ